MISVPILARFLGRPQEPQPSEAASALPPTPRPPLRLDPSVRYYLLSDFHLEPHPTQESRPLLRLLERLLAEGGIGGIFLLGDLAARPGTRYEDLAAAHGRLFELLYRLTLLTPVILVQGECDLSLELPPHLRQVERFEDEEWIFLHGYQFDPEVAIEPPREGAPPAVTRGDPDVEATLAGLRGLRERSGKKIVFGHLHRAGYLEPGLTCLGHWTGGAADYAIIHRDQIYLSQGRPPRRR